MDNPKESQQEIERQVTQSILRAKKAREEAERRRSSQRRLGWLTFVVIASCFALFLILYPR